MMSDNVTTYTSAVDELTDSLSSEEVRTVLGWKPGHQMEVHYKEVFLICRTVGMTYQSKMLGRAHITLPALQMIIIEVEVIIGVVVSLKPFLAL